MRPQKHSPRLQPGISKTHLTVPLELTSTAGFSVTLISKQHGNTDKRILRYACDDCDESHIRGIVHRVTLVLPLSCLRRNLPKYGRFPTAEIVQTSNAFGRNCTKLAGEILDSPLRPAFDEKRLKARLHSAFPPLVLCFLSSLSFQRCACFVLNAID